MEFHFHVSKAQAHIYICSGWAFIALVSLKWIALGKMER